MPATVHCIQCGKSQTVCPGRVASYKFCSYACRGEFRRLNWRGENHPRWKGGQREKECQHCKATFRWKGGALKTFLKQKFCSKPCADKGGFRFEGESHPNWKPESRRKSNRGKHDAWARAVISRDKATCQHCHATGIEMHAHHVKTFADHPELRWDVNNGLTLCYRCHWTVHTASNAKAENSGNTPPAQAEGNPEPSFRGNLVEGVTTRGRAFRRWVGTCSECGTFLSKRASDAKGKIHNFCNKSCASKHAAKHRTYRPMRSPIERGSNASTSTAPERDEIV